VIDVSNVATNVVFGIWKTASESLKLHEEIGDSICVPTGVHTKYNLEKINKDLKDGKVKNLPGASALTGDKTEQSFTDESAVTSEEDKNKINFFKKEIINNSPPNCIGYDCQKNAALATSLIKSIIQKAKINKKIKMKNLTKKNIIDCSVLNEIGDLGEIKFIEWKSWRDENNRPNAEFLLRLFAFGIMHVELLPFAVDGQSLSEVNLNAIFSFILMIILFVVVFSLLVVAIVRVIMLWINIAMSPLFVLLPVIQKATGKGLGKVEEMIGISPFINFAFLPALIALPLVIGLLMIMVGKIQMGVTNDFKTVFMKINSIQEFLWMTISIVVVWQSVEIAKNSGGPIASAIVGKVSGFVTDQAKFLAKLPTYANMIPIYSGGKDGKLKGRASVHGLLGAVQNIPGQLQSKSISDAASLIGTRDKYRSDESKKIADHLDEQTRKYFQDSRKFEPEEVNKFKNELLNNKSWDTAIKQFSDAGFRNELFKIKDVEKRKAVVETLAMENEVGKKSELNDTNVRTNVHNKIE
jgi:hypothetical protein